MYGDLEVDHDLTIERRDWRAHRVAGVLILLIVIVALLGLVGPGPLSWASASSEDGELEVTYSRFDRRGSNAELSVDVTAALASGGQFQVRVDSSYLDVLSVQQITPEPDGVSAEGDFLVYTFSQQRPGSPLSVTFDGQPRGLWRVWGEVSAGGREVSFWQFLYP